MQKTRKHKKTLESPPFGQRPVVPCHPNLGNACVSCVSCLFLEPRDSWEGQEESPPGSRKRQETQELPRFGQQPVVPCHPTLGNSYVSCVSCLSLEPGEVLGGSGAESSKLQKKIGNTGNTRISQAWPTSSGAMSPKPKKCLCFLSFLSCPGAWGSLGRAGGRVLQAPQKDRKHRKHKKHRNSLGLGDNQWRHVTQT